ncbi:MAG: DNA ligase (NAD+) [Glaciecola sp.]|jgi:DNA ligase (NAD+)
MNSSEAKKRVDELSVKLHDHNHRYYLLDAPIISDKDFDVLLNELQSLELKSPELALKNSPTKRVGGGITKNFDTVTHKYPMLSLGNSYSQEDLLDFENRVKKILNEEQPLEYTAELKYDGVAIGLRYKNGELAQAVTRGDGTQGDDVTTNVRTIKSIPLQLQGDYPNEFEIRGEIFMPKKAFEALNIQKEEAGEALMANPRNTASGTLKMQNSKVVADRNLDCILYHMIGDDLPFDTHFDNLKAATLWGFKMPTLENKYIKKCLSLQGVFDFIAYWDTKRNDLGFEVDGVVVKVNSLPKQVSLGFTAKSPRWAIAFKFETERASTKLLSVDYQVGRTGSVTPVANLRPVLLLGTTVKRASLHNEDFISGLGLHFEDEVYVEKGGEIIPKVVGVNEDLRLKEAKAVEHIKHCPECKSELQRKEGEVNYYCVNESECPPQITGRIQHFISRKAMNVDGLGDETIEQLYSAGLVKNIADLYDLNGGQLLPLERMAEKSVNNLILGLIESKKVPFPRVLFGLGIRFVGQTVAKKLAMSLRSLQAIRTASVEDLIAVDEIGEIIAKSVVNYFAVESNNNIVDRLVEAGLQFELSKDEGSLNEGVLTGMSVVVSGVFQEFSRDELKSLIEEHGGKNVSGISKSTSYVVAGDKMGPSKKNKAEKLGVNVITEKEFISLLL